MRPALWNIHELLLAAYDELQTMQITLQRQLNHSAGWIEKRTVYRKRGQVEKYYWIYYKDGQRKSQHISSDRIVKYQEKIELNQLKQKELRSVLQNLRSVQKCFQILKINPESVNQYKPIEPSLPQTRQQNRYPENLKHLTLKGEYVRSKSEALLANLFYYHKIPYEYEKQLILDGQSIHPDFTILLPNGSPLYWEHLGMLISPNMPETGPDAANYIGRMESQKERIWLSPRIIMEHSTSWTPYLKSNLII